MLRSGSRWQRSSQLLRKIPVYFASLLLCEAVLLRLRRFSKARRQRRKRLFSALSLSRQKRKIFTSCDGSNGFSDNKVSRTPNCLCKAKGRGGGDFVLSLFSGPNEKICKTNRRNFLLSASFCFSFFDFSTKHRSRYRFLRKKAILITMCTFPAHGEGRGKKPPVIVRSRLLHTPSRAKEGRERKK